MFRQISTLISVALLIVVVNRPVAGGNPTFPTTIEVPNGKVTVSLLRAGVLLLVPIRINQAEPVLFILDTGASHTILDAKLAEQMSLRCVTDTTARTFGGGAAVRVYAADSIGVGNAVLYRTMLGTMDMSRIQKELGTEQVKGFLGDDFLSKLPFSIDWGKATLTLYDRRSFVPPAGAPPQKLRCVDGLFLTRVSIEDQLQGWFTVDTGSTVSLLCYPAYAQLERPFFTGRPSRQSLVLGAGGLHRGRLMLLTKAKLFGVDRQRVEGSYSFESGATTPDGSAGAIGWKLLLDYQLTFDYATETAWATYDPDTTPAEWDKADFNPNTTDVIGTTPLMRAARLGRLKYVASFLIKGADVNRRDMRGYTAIHEAAASAKAVVVHSLLAAHADVNVKSKEDVTPLHLAAQDATADVVNELVKAGAEVDATDMFGKTALIAAAEASKADVVAVLLRAGAKPDIVSASSATALSAASGIGANDVVAELLRAGANPNVTSSAARGKKTPLMEAALSGSLEIASLLLDHGADVNAADVYRQTALCMAAGRGHINIVRVLLEHKADKRLRDVEGMTALEYAAGNGYVDVASLLYYDNGPKATASVGIAPGRASSRPFTSR